MAKEKNDTFISFELSRKGCNFFVSKMLVFSLTLAEIIKDSSGVSLHFAPTLVNNQKKVEIHYKFFVMGKESHFS